MPWEKGDNQLDSSRPSRFRPATKKKKAFLPPLLPPTPLFVVVFLCGQWSFPLFFLNLFLLRLWGSCKLPLKLCHDESHQIKYSDANWDFFRLNVLEPFYKDIFWRLYNFLAGVMIWKYLKGRRCVTTHPWASANCFF